MKYKRINMDIGSKFYECKNCGEIMESPVKMHGKKLHNGTVTEKSYCWEKNTCYSCSSNNLEEMNSDEVYNLPEEALNRVVWVHRTSHIPAGIDILDLPSASEAKENGIAKCKYCENVRKIEIQFNLPNAESAE